MTTAIFAFMCPAASASIQAESRFHDWKNGAAADREIIVG